MSHVRSLHHLVLATKHRKQTIDFAHERELYAFLYKFLTARGCFVHRINGMPDHVHILFDLHPTWSNANLVKVLKTESSKVLSHNPHFQNWESWCEGYSATSVGPEGLETRKQYIINQKQHHQNVTFEEEYRQLMQENGMECDHILGDDDDD